MNDNAIFKQFDLYRSEDKHECGLLSTRVSALLTSQSVLVAVTIAVLKLGSGPAGTDRTIAAILATAGIIMNVHASIAIMIGCRVLHAWHKFGNGLIEKNPGLLAGLSLERKQPDVRHKVSIDSFNLSVPLLFGSVWFLLISKMGLWDGYVPMIGKHGALPACVVFLGVWLAMLTVVWVTASIGNEKAGRLRGLFRTGWRGLSHLWCLLKRPSKIDAGGDATSRERRQFEGASFAEKRASEKV